MTIIAAIHDGETTWLGSDLLAGVSGERKFMPDETGKWIIRSGWAFANSGLLLANRVVQAHWSEIFPSPVLPSLDMKGMFGIGQIIASKFREAGIEPDIEEHYRNPLWGGHIIVARAGMIWHYDGAMAPTEVPAGDLVAIGSGTDSALSAAYAVRKFARAPDGIRDLSEAVEIAVDTACRFNTDCEGIWFGKLGPG